MNKEIPGNAFIQHDNNSGHLTLAEQSKPYTVPLNVCII